jgi:hypothetical protein
MVLPTPQSMFYLGWYFVRANVFLVLIFGRDLPSRYFVDMVMHM